MTTKQEWDEFAARIIPTLRRMGYIDSKLWKCVKISILIVVVLGFFSFLYFLSVQIQEGKFQVVDNSSCNNFNSNTCPECQVCPIQNCECSPTFICNMSCSNVELNNSGG